MYYSVNCIYINFNVCFFILDTFYIDSVDSHFEFKKVIDIFSWTAV